MTEQNKELQNQQQQQPDQQTDAAKAAEQLALKGDLKGLTKEQKVAYYNQVCHSLGLNPLTNPFQVLELNGKEVLYAKKDATDQLRSINGISVVDQQNDPSFADQGIYITRVTVEDRHGRQDTASGTVDINGMKGEKLANSILKAETKAKRRATLSICGLGLLDETEAESAGGSDKPIESEATIEDEAASADAYEAALEDFKACETVERMREIYNNRIEQAKREGLNQTDLSRLKQELQKLKQDKAQQ